jgi:phage-related protein
MREDILDFQVRLYSPDGVNSPVEDYLDELAEINERLWIKCVDQILNLPLLVFTRHKSIKPFEIKNTNLFELKVRHDNNAIRFFFIIERPNVIVLYGFTKKSQKTDKRDIKQGLKNLKQYLQTKKSITLD